MSDEQIADHVRETRNRWEPVDEPPEGWRRCDYSEFSPDAERWFVLYTNAPRDKNPHSYDTFWQTHRRIVQERWVTPWQDVDPALIDGSTVFNGWPPQNWKPDHSDGSESA